MIVTSAGEGPSRAEITFILGVPKTTAEWLLRMPLTGGEIQYPPVDFP